MDESIFEFQEISDELLQDIQVFASQLKDNYALRNQDNSRAKLEQAVDGKIGEWIAYLALCPFFIDLTTPDMIIYSARQKNWDSDMKSGDLGFACKTCNWQSTQINSPSWIFNKADSKGYGEDKEIHKYYENKIAVMVQLQLKRTKGQIRAIVPVAKLHKEKLFCPPKKEELRDFKDAVYLSGLQIKGLSGQIPDCTIDLIKSVIV